MPKLFYSKNASEPWAPTCWLSLSLLVSWSSTQSFNLHLFWTRFPHQQLLLARFRSTHGLIKKLRSSPGQTFHFLLFSLSLCCTSPLHTVLRARKTWSPWLKKKKRGFEWQGWFYSSPVTQTAGWIWRELQIIKMQNLVNNENHCLPDSVT